LPWSIWSDGYLIGRHSVLGEVTERSDGDHGAFTGVQVKGPMEAGYRCHGCRRWPEESELVLRHADGREEGGAARQEALYQAGPGSEVCPDKLGWGGYERHVANLNVIDAS